MDMKTEGATFGGVRIPAELPDDTFYGFRLDPLTGSLTVEVIGSESDGVIAMPQEDVLSANDYRQWLWTTNTLDFEFNAQGRLRMKVM